MDLATLTRRFLMNEAQGPNIQSYILALGEVIQNIKPGTQRDQRRLEVAKSHLREIKRHTRRLQERVNVLEERVNVLEEQKGD
tara:strand:+ start:1043 stop:1291 length:249 start_codon:yes stop_codon:yes gene_type:complete